jgi:hypothetical protein
VPAPTATAAPAAAAGAFELDDFDVDVGEASAGPDPFAGVTFSGAASSGARWTPAGAWPANAPSLEVAEEALLAAVDSMPPPYPELANVAAQVAAAISELEVKALGGQRLAIDGAPIRRAAAMRVRVGYAFATAPPVGSHSDSGAVAALLGEIDGLLSEVSDLAADASAEVAPTLGACRNALVKEAIDFSEAAQRYVAVESPAATAAPVKRAPTPGAARVLSVEKGTPAPVNRSQRALVVVLAVAVLVAGAFHGYRYYQRRQAALAAPPALPGIPSGFSAFKPAASAPTVLQQGGGAVDRAEIERFKDVEKAKGNDVLELPGGVMVVKPAEPAREGAAAGREPAAPEGGAR